MRWIPFAILLYLTAVLQSTLAPFLAVHSIRPDFLVIVAVHYALAARATDALIACWIIGFVTDLTTLSIGEYGNVGIHAFAFGLAALAIVALREITFRESVITQIVCTFLARVVVAGVTGLHLLWVADAWSRTGEILLVGVYSAAYTAAIAPYGHWLLRRGRGLLGIGVTHRLRVG
ncbi:rod shape-determining protein MreD [Phycisphaerae bacterium RAS2]|jgi:rod shape-determining protein MreD|nr:rod shape-determining protein MreD [Phycisphaerae bacterium RAS2]